MDSDTTPNICQFIVVKKQRRCRMQVKKGQKYCGEHMVSESESKRIPCPKDSKHTVSLSQLEKHLLKCNGRLSNEPWIRENFNLPSTNVNREFNRPTEQQIFDAIAVLRRIYPQIEDQIRELTRTHKFYDDYIVKEATEVKNEKRNCHLMQMGSIIDHLHSYNLLHDDPNSCLIDLGSGKAQLIYWLTKKAPKCRYLLVDRQGARNKYDNKALLENPDLKITRVRCSIEHLDLSQLPIVQECKQSITAICKHFCGNAMDTGIRCIENAIKQGVQFNGFAFASCCHHRCTWDEFSGLDYLKLVGIRGEEDFSALRHVSTWATCNFQESELVEQSIINAEKLELGRQAKRLLEFARARHLASLGYRVELFKYVDYEVSPENLLIVGYMDENTDGGKDKLF